MTTPPQGPWGPGQPGGQPGGQQGGGQGPGQGHGQGQGQGGWGQQQPGQGGGGWGQRPGPQPQQPQQNPPQGQPPQQGGGGWGQRPGQQPGQGGGGWGQQTPQQGQPGGYQQQSWGQKGPGQQSGWQQQGQQPWQSGGPGAPKGPGGGLGKDKMPMYIGGGVIGVVLIALLIFLGVRALGGNDDPVADPTSQPTGNPSTPGGDPTNGQQSELGNATGQAKNATDKLQAQGFQCSDLFNGAQGAHRGCFKYDGATEAEAIFQFSPDGTIIGVLLQSANAENVNNASVTFDAALQAVGNDTFGGSEVAKIQEAVKTGQKSSKVGSTWGEFELRNDGDALQISGGKSGADSFELPRKEFQTTEAQLTAALKPKKYTCTSSCRKTIGQYGSQSIFAFGGSKSGIRSLEIRASGDPADVKAAMPGVTADAFAVLKGPDVAALKAWVGAHNDGKSYASYVSGWRVEITGDDDSSYSSHKISITYESFYV